MKKFTIVTTILALLVLWSGMAKGAEPIPKKSSTQPTQKQSPGSSQQPGSKTLTTPGVSVPAAFVDLAVTDIRVQEFGQGALIQVTVKNLGTATADANLYKLRIMLDGNPLQGGDQPIFNARNPIEPNQTRGTGIIPDKSGRTEVTARLIPSGAATSDNPVNNILTRTLDLSEVRPDFTVADLSLKPDNRIQVTIRNNGGYAPRDPQGTVEVYADNSLIDTINVREWPKPRETKVIATENLISGTRNVRATVNPNRNVLEFNYENNSLTKKFTAHVLKPDLIVRALGIWVTEHFPVDRLVICIENIGKGPSPHTIKADVFHEDRPIGTPTLVGPLERGQEKCFNTDIGAVRGFTFRVTVDPQNEIDEEREDNNSLTGKALFR